MMTVPAKLVARIELGKGRGEGKAGDGGGRPLDLSKEEGSRWRLKGWERDEEGRVRQSRQRAEAAEKGEREGNGVGRGWWRRR